MVSVARFRPLPSTPNTLSKLLGHTLFIHLPLKLPPLQLPPPPLHLRLNLLLIIFIELVLLLNLPLVQVPVHYFKQLLVEHFEDLAKVEEDEAYVHKGA